MRGGAVGTVGYNAAVAADIDDRGQIVGFVTDNCGGGCRDLNAAYVWTPKQG